MGTTASAFGFEIAFEQGVAGVVEEKASFGSPDCRGGCPHFVLPASGPFLPASDGASTVARRSIASLRRSCSLRRSGLWRIAVPVRQSASTAARISAACAPMRWVISIRMR